MPDIFLPVARGKFHGLYIEMKLKGGRVTDLQQEMLERLRGQGYCAVVCFGFDDARKLIEDYYKKEMQL